MRKASIAEWILSLATTPERAAAAVGDLLERPSGFLLSVLGTFVSLIIDALVSSPFTFIGWAVLAIFAQGALSLLDVSIVLLLHQWAPTLHEIEIGYCFWSFVIGHELSRFLRERALATYLVFAILNGVLILIEVLTWKVGRPQVDRPAWVFSQLACLAGVVLFRRRHLHKHA
ncbi:MAG: hypothetical protein ABSB15_00325 [Bryobacteraceae bacterium]|jgi:hypothetical protein